MPVMVSARLVGCSGDDRGKAFPRKWDDVSNRGVLALFFEKKRLLLLFCGLGFPWHNELFEDAVHAHLNGMDCFGVATIGLQVRVESRLQPLMRKELLAAIDDGYLCLAEKWGSCQRVQETQQAEIPGWPLEQESMKQKERRRIGCSKKPEVDGNIIRSEGRKTH